MYTQKSDKKSLNWWFTPEPSSSCCNKRAGLAQSATASLQNMTPMSVWQCYPPKVILKLLIVLQGYNLQYSDTTPFGLKDLLYSWLFEATFTQQNLLFLCTPDSQASEGGLSSHLYTSQCSIIWKLYLDSKSSATGTPNKLTQSVQMP